MHIPPAEGNFKESGKAVKPLIIEEYTTHVAYVDLSDGMADSCSVSKKTWEWAKILLPFIRPYHSECRSR
jgi:hypothetical protein